MMTPITTSNAPAAGGPYSQAIKAGGMLYVSGQLPLSVETGEIVSEDPVDQLRQCLTNIAMIAEAAGCSLADTVKATVLLTDLSGFDAINAEYARFFTAPFPARLCYEVSRLPKGARVEVEAVLACA